MADDPEALSSSPVQDAPDPLTGPLDDLAADLDAHPDLNGDTDYRARQYVRRYVVEKAIPQAQQELAREYDNRGELVIPGDDERITLDLDEIRRDIKADLGEFARRNEDWLDEVIADTITEPFGKTPDPVKPNQPGGGDPVLGFNGEFVYVNDDFRVSGAGIDFVFRRTYRNQAVYRGPLGVNWDHQYDVLLWADDARTVLTTGELRRYEYLRHPRHGQAGFSYYQPPDGEHSVMLAEGESFVRRAPDGVRHVFAPDPQWPGGHRLARIEDRHGNYLAFSYADGRLDTVLVNHPDRVVRFGYDPLGRIEVVSDHTGRRWRYRYDDLGNLTEYCTPATPDHPHGLVTRYEYRVELPAPFAHDLVRVIDPAGRIYLENEYGGHPGYHDFNRVVRQRHGSGETLWQYEVVQRETDYPPAQQPAWQTNEIDPCGHPIHHVYNEFGNLLLREETVGGRPLRWRYRYNVDGELTASLSPEGVLTQYLYGREVFLRRHGATDAAVAGHDSLTAAERMAFGRVIAVVRRATRITFPPAGGQRVWAEGLPDVFAVDPDDIVVKFSYELDYGQLLTRSDPRTTKSPDPAYPESPAHAAGHTRYAYTGPTGDPHRLLAAVEDPRPTNPDGTPAEPVVTRHLEYDERGRPLRIADPAGTITEFSYFGAADGVREGFLRSTVLDPGGLSLITEYEVDDLGRITAVRSPRGAGEPPGRFVTRYRHNALDQLVEIVSPPPFARATRYGYDRTGQLTRIETDARDDTGTDLPGGPRVQTYRFDEQLNLLAETVGGKDERDHLVTAHRYDAADRLVSTVLPAGNRVDYRYDQRHRMTALTLGVGAAEQVTTHTDYDGDDLAIRTVGGRGHVTLTSYDTFGRAVQVVDPAGTVTRRSYDKAGNPTVERVFERRADGLVLLTRTEYRYDELNRPVELVRNLFDAPAPASDLDDHEGAPGPGELVVSRAFYDAAGRVIRTVNPLGREQRFGYDAAGRLTVEIDALGNRREHRYDPHGNPVRTDVHELVRDSGGTATGQQVLTSAWVYDELDRPISATDGLGNTTTVGYDGFGNVTRRADPVGMVTRAEFDLVGRQVSVTEGAVTIRFDHDRNGNLVAVTDALGRTTTHHYDALDRLVRIDFPAGSRTEYRYDADGGLAAVHEPDGVRRTYTRDAGGRPTRISVAGPVTVEGPRVVSFGYDGLGRVTTAANDVVTTSFQVDSLGRVVAETMTFADPPLPQSLVVRRRFDPAGSVVEREYPGGRRLRLIRDELDRVVRVDHLASGVDYPGGPTPAATVASLTYAGLRLSRAEAPGGAGTTWRYDGAARPIAVEHTAGGRALLAIGQLYDGAGNLRLRTETSPTGARHEVFGYDPLHRLVGVSERPGAPSIDERGIGPPPAAPPDPVPRRQDAVDRQLPALPGPAEPVWTLDAVDNRSAERRPGRPPLAYATNVLDQYTRVGSTELAYDERGNLVSDGRFRLGYDGWNRLASVAESRSGR
jgi:YD repeat-containing protein